MRTLLSPVIYIICNFKMFKFNVTKFIYIILSSIIKKNYKKENNECNAGETSSDEGNLCNEIDASTIKPTSTPLNAACFVDLSESCCSNTESKENNVAIIFPTEETSERRARDETASSHIIIPAKSKPKYIDQPPNSNILQRIEFKRQHTTAIKFCFFCCEVFLKKADNTVSNLIWAFTSIVEMYLGLRYLTECPIKNFIPVQLFLSGLFCLICSLISLAYKSAKLTMTWSLKMHDLTTTLISALKWVLLFWHCLGCYLVYSIVFPETIKLGKRPYCNATLYEFSFLIANLWLFLIACLIFVFMSSYCYYVKKKRLSLNERDAKTTASAERVT